MKVVNKRNILAPAGICKASTLLNNPNASKLTIVSSYVNPVQIQLIDMTGRQLRLTQKITAGACEMDVSRFVQGCYILLVTDTKKNKTFRIFLIKQH